MVLGRVVGHKRARYTYECGRESFHAEPNDSSLIRRKKGPQAVVRKLGAPNQVDRLQIGRISRSIREDFVVDTRG